MAELFASGRIVDCILILMLVEGCGSLLLNEKLQRSDGRRPVLPASILFNLGAGAGLLMGLRAALTHAGWPTIAVWLMVALLGHVGEMAARWSGRVPAPEGLRSTRP